MTVEQRRTVYRGRVVTLDVEAVTLPNGHTSEFEIVRHPGGAAAVAIDERGQVCLLHHYRPAVGAWLWEIPAGKLDGGEAPLLAAQRELREEAGLLAREWRRLGHVVTSPGVFTETVHLYLATGLQHQPASPEHGELFEIGWTPLADAAERALAGDIVDAKTVIALTRAQRLLRA